MEEQAGPEPEAAEEIKQKSRRRGRKRTRFGVPKKMPVPVRALWESASQEEQERAHRTCCAILENWLGRSSKQEVMERLHLPALRVWQLSQQALGGMLAGLLKQPRTRGGASMPKDPESDPKQLRKKIEQLERELELAQDVIKLLRELPGNRNQRKGKGAKSSARAGKKKVRRPASADSLPSSGDVARGDEGPQVG